LTKATSRKQIQKTNHTNAKEAQCNEREKRKKINMNFLTMSYTQKNKLRIRKSKVHSRIQGLIP